MNVRTTKSGHSVSASTPHPFTHCFTGPAWPDRFGEWIAQWSCRELAAPIRTLSLFTGAGGLDIGFRQAGFHACELVEFDRRFIPTLEANVGIFGLLGDALPQCIDVRDYIPTNLTNIDFIIGGPPCQSFSAAGRRAGGVTGSADERGQLFLAYVRLLQTIKPRGFLFENVYGITGANGGRDWDTICNAFASAGYRVFHRVLDAADFGVPQHRERMFIVGLREGSYHFPRPTHGPDSPQQIPLFDAGTAARDTPEDPADSPGRVNGRYGHLLQQIPPGLNYSFFTERLGHPNPLFAWRSKFSDFLYKADPARPVRTIKAQGGQYTGPFHWDNRAFTVPEFKRLQTFPDNYVIKGSRAVAIQQIGNSVPPQMARILALSILSQVFGASIPLDLPLLQHDDKLGFRTRKRELTKYYLSLARSKKPRATKPSRVDTTPATRYVVLTENFRLVERAESEGGLLVRFRANTRTWRFSVGYPESDTGGSGFCIQVSPRQGSDWPLPCKSVFLEGTSLDMSVFTVAWKVFESELQRRHLKADLVQLSGYYQYNPAFTASMELRCRANWKWRSLARVVAGHGTRETLAEDVISAAWGINASRLLEFAKFLRLLGLEVRNHSTNPQIPETHWLLPYCFPSLSPKSVQLRKELIA